METGKYLETMAAQIRSRRAREMAVEEMKAHIEDQTEAYRAQGFSEEKAQEKAVEQMGDPVRAGVELDRIHRPKMEWRLFWWIVGFSVLGLGLQYFCYYRLAEMPGGVKFYFIRQCVYTAAGLGLMAGVCLCDYSLLGRWPEALGACFLGMICLICKSGIMPMYNGAYGYIKCLMYFFIPIYAGILYKSRGKGLAGIGICCLWIGTSFLTGARFIGGGFSVIGDVMAVCVVMVLIAAYREWFGVSKKAGVAVVSGVFAAAGVFLLANLKHYQRVRLQVMFHPEEFADTAGYQLNGIRQIVSSLFMNQNCYRILERNGLLRFWNNTGIQSEYMILQSAVVMGLAKTIVLCALYAMFFAYLFSMAVKEKNSLGFMAATGCTMILALETVRNVLYNFGFGLSSTAGIPFFSYGKVHTLAVYGLLGVLLSVCRYRNLVWDRNVSGKRETNGELRVGNYVIRVEKRMSARTAKG